ncbi:MAG TPA: MFS transporter [Candidatus Angelobacter sp.]|nr:MFS transporter [Candidatus Angelobacter sp.]
MPASNANISQPTTVPPPALLGRIFSSTNLVLLMVCLMYALTYIDRINVGTAGPIFQKELHFSPNQLGSVVSAFGWAYLVLQVWGGWLSDRFGARLTLTVCAVIWAGSTVLMGLAGSFTAMVLCRILLGLGEGATFPTATRALADWMPADKRGFAQGITHAFARLGNFLTPPLVAWLVVVGSWRMSFFALGGISLVWALVWWLYFRDDPSTHRGITQRELSFLPSFTAKKDRRKDPVPWWPLVKRVAPVTLVYFCYGWTLWLYLTFLPSFFMHGYKLNLKNSALFSSGVYLLGVVGDAAGGWVSDLILKRTGDRNKARRNLVIAGFLLSLVFMVPVLRSHDLNTVAICLSAAFFFAEFTIGPFWAIPMDIAPRFSGSASGLMNIGSALAAAVSPQVAFFVIQKTGNWDLPFLGSIGLLLFGAIMAYWMKPNEPLPGTELGAVAARA